MNSIVSGQWVLSYLGRKPLHASDLVNIVEKLGKNIGEKLYPFYHENLRISQSSKIKLFKILVSFLLGDYFSFGPCLIAFEGNYCYFLRGSWSAWDQTQGSWTQDTAQWVELMLWMGKLDWSLALHGPLRTNWNNPLIQNPL